MDTQPKPAETIKMGRFAPAWRRFAYRMMANSFFVRTVRTADGAFDTYVSGGSQLSVLDPRGVKIDHVHARFIAKWVKPDSVVWDVGGNMGLFAFPAALKASRGRVYTVEPDVELACNLVKSLRRKRNAGLPVTVLPFALSNVDGSASFLIASHGRSMNKLDGVGAWHDNLFVASETRTVAVVRIDTIAKNFRPPDIVKIDVEGAEMMVLEGGRATIAASRPVMLVEGPGDLWEPLRAYLASLDYVMFDGQFDDPPQIDMPVWDTVAVPREKLT